MNRSRTIPRDFGNEGSERSQQLGLALAAQCDPGFLEALFHHVSAVQEFGGEFYVGAARLRFDRAGNVVDQGGSFETYAYAVAYNKKARIRGQEIEPDEPYEEQDVPGLDEPEAIEEPALEPEPVSANSG